MSVPFLLKPWPLFLSATCEQHHLQPFWIRSYERPSLGHKA
jgi:hypothetical protein